MSMTCQADEEFEEALHTHGCSTCMAQDSCKAGTQGKRISRFLRCICILRWACPGILILYFRLGSGPRLFLQKPACPASFKEGKKIGKRSSTHLGRRFIRKDTAANTTFYPMSVVIAAGDTDSAFFNNASSMETSPNLRFQHLHVDSTSCALW